MGKFLLLLRREVWENKRLVILPIIYLLALVGFSFYSLKSYSEAHTTSTSSNLPKESLVMIMHYAFIFLAYALTFIFNFVSSISYLVGSLYHERIDGSIAFWKSLPISDIQTIFSKFTIAFLLTSSSLYIFPLSEIYLQAMKLYSDSENLNIILKNYDNLAVLKVIFNLTMIGSIFVAPIYSWILFCSAVSNKFPLLFSLIIPVTVGILTKKIFEINIFTYLIHKSLDSLHHFFSSIHSNSTNAYANIARIIESTSFINLVSTPAFWGHIAVSLTLLCLTTFIRYKRNI